MTSNTGYRQHLKPVFLIFLLALFLRMILPWFSHGFVQMDEHWQVIEPANSLLGHPWSQAVEWKEGLRNWFYPWLVSKPMRLAEILGFQEPIWINSFVRMLHGLISSFSIFLIYFGLLKANVDKKWALATALFIALWPYALYCGFHTHGEMLGALFIALAAALPGFFPSTGGYLVSGFFFGFALALKIDLAAAGLGYGLYQLCYGSLKSRFQRALALLIGVLPFVVCIGFIDKISWGSWFHSVLGHAKVNLVDAIGNQWGTSPWYYHFLYYWDIGGVFVFLGTLALPLTYFKLSRWIKSTLFMNIFFILVFSFIEHKEKRFMSPLIYTGQLVGVSSLYFFWKKYQTQISKKTLPILLSALVFIIALHGGINTYLYLIKQPFANRIWAMKNAGNVPGIEAMFSPQWPAVFYLPRHVRSENFENSEPQYIAQKLKPYHHISIAVDWGDLWPVEDHGFKCHPWPEPKSPEVKKMRDIPWAYSCVRK